MKFMSSNLLRKYLLRKTSLLLVLILYFQGFSQLALARVTAGNDQINVATGRALRIDVLTNDIVQNGSLDVTSIEIVQQPENGYINVRSSGAVQYTHDGGPSTKDSFTYTVRDSSGARSNVATVIIKVQASSTAPQAAAKTQSQTQPAAQQKQQQTAIAITSSAGLNAFHRSGQTFLTWPETAANDHYHVYRSAMPITAASLSAARKLTGRWGPLDSDTSVNKTGGAKAPSHHVIVNLGAPLNDSTGLFVYTTQPGDSASAYYAITVVRNGVEFVTTPITLGSPVAESVQEPQEILVLSINQGKGRMFTHFMDYSNWNPTFNGYAYNYTVALPANYNPRKSYPLAVVLHAHSARHRFEPHTEYNWEIIQLFPNDPGTNVGYLHSWWYGYAADHNYQLDGRIPSAGRIENFTEQRVMRAVDEVITNPDFNVDRKLVHGYGQSMGASGLLALAMRYPSVISGVLAGQPMTNYAGNPKFRSNFERLWGLQSSNLPIINRGPHSGKIQSYNNIGVWDWMNHQKQLVERRGDDFGFIMTSHGKLDDVIDWQTQGKPVIQAYTDANIGFTATYRETGHTSAGFNPAVKSMFGFGYNVDFGWKYPLDLSFPAIQKATGSSPVIPASSGEDQYNMDFEWATPHMPFDTRIVDRQERYEITIRSTTSAQQADITPRRTQKFRVTPGVQCSWGSFDRNSNRNNGSGRVTADADSLVTVRNVSIASGTGTRLVITCP